MSRTTTYNNNQFRKRLIILILSGIFIIVGILGYLLYIEHQCYKQDNIAVKYAVVSNHSQEYKLDAVRDSVKQLLLLVARKNDTIKAEQQEKRYQQERADQNSSFLKNWIRTYGRMAQDNRVLLDSLKFAAKESAQKQADLISTLSDSAFINRISESALKGYEGSIIKEDEWITARIELFKDSVRFYPMTVKEVNEIAGKVITKKRPGPFGKHLGKVIEVDVRSLNPYSSPNVTTKRIALVEETEIIPRPKKVNHTAKRPPRKLKYLNQGS